MNSWNVNRDTVRFGDRVSDKRDAGFSVSEARKAKRVFTILFALLVISLLTHRWSPERGFHQAIRMHDPVLLEKFLEDLGEGCVARGEYLAAIAAFETLLETYPDSTAGDMALCKIALCWLCLDKADRAIETWERFLKLYPDSKYAARVWRSYLTLLRERPRGIQV